MRPDELLKNSHEMTCPDISSKAFSRTTKKYAGKVTKQIDAVDRHIFSVFPPSFAPENINWKLLDFSFVPSLTESIKEAQN